MNWTLLPSRLFLAIKLEWLTLWTPGCGLLYIFNKWLSVLQNKKSMPFLGRQFHFEDRLAPFMIFTYIGETRRCIDLCREDGGQSPLRVLEIGGNIGNWGICWLHQEPATQLYTFEPNNNPFKFLQANAKDFKNWKIFNFGVGAENSRRQFFFVDGKSGQGSLFSENANKNLLGQGAVQTTEIELKRLDVSFCESHLGGCFFDFVKVDVEGAEWEVMEGLSAIQWKHMYVELNLRNGEKTINDFVSMCRAKWKSVEVVEAKSYSNGNCDLFLRSN